MNQRKTDFLNYLKHLSVTTLVHNVDPVSRTLNKKVLKID